MSGLPGSRAEFAIERLAIKAERIALARAETMVRARENRSEWADARLLRPLLANDN